MQNASEDEMPKLSSRRQFSKTTLEILGFGFQLQLAKMQYFDLLASDGLIEEQIIEEMDSKEMHYLIVFMTIGTSLASFGYILRILDIAPFTSFVGCIAMYIGLLFFVIQMLKNKKRIDATKLNQKFTSFLNRRK